MAWILLAPVRDENLLAAGHHVPIRLQFGKSPGDDACAVVRIGARIVPYWRGLPWWRVIGVQDVHPRIGGEVGRQREAEESAVPHVVHVCRKVREDSGR